MDFTIADLERAYHQAMKGSDEPNMVVCPYGVIASDGHVYDFDSEGNLYPIGEHEEERRQQIVAWLQRAKDLGVTK